MSKTLLLLPFAVILAFLAPSVSTRMRLAQIERELSAPPTGAQADADKRVSLRAERDVLTGKARMAATRNPATALISRNVASVQSPQIIVARDSRVAERAAYEREQRLSVETTRRSIEAFNDGRPYVTTCPRR